MSALPDEGETADAQKRVESLLTTLYERYHAEVYTYCRRCLRNHEEAEDAAQVTFAKAFSAFRRGVVPDAEAAWLFTIAKRVVLTRLEATQRLRAVETVTELDDHPAPEPADRSELHELHRAVEELPDASRRAFVMREWQGLQYEEIADELGLQRNHVGVILLRARRQVVKQLRGVLSVGPLSSALQRGLEMLSANGAHLAAATAVAASAPVLVAIAPRAAASPQAATALEPSSSFSTTQPSFAHLVSLPLARHAPPAPAVAGVATVVAPPPPTAATFETVPAVTLPEVDPIDPIDQAPAPDPTAPAEEAPDQAGAGWAPPPEDSGSKPDPVASEQIDSDPDADADAEPGSSEAPVTPVADDVGDGETGAAADPPSDVQPGQDQASPATTGGDASDQPPSPANAPQAASGNAHASARALSQLDEAA